MNDVFTHTLNFGATLRDDGTTQFRLWAPDCTTVALEIDAQAPVTMTPEAGGWFTATVKAPAGTRYRFRVRPDLAVPDPASRLQSGDVHGWSVVTDPRAFHWQNRDWRGRPWHETVLYELHVGTMGGYRGVQDRLPVLVALGVTAIELMPLADFPGRHNWGYDGTLNFAPDDAYGTPDELKAMIDAAHGLGLMVFLDVVYNHFGPDGNYIGAYASAFFREDVPTPWGAAIDFRKAEVRDFFIGNALYWLCEFRFDGLRFDAVHTIVEDHFLDDMAVAIRAGVGQDRYVHLVLEHDGNVARHLRTGPDAAGFDAQWNDDVHHCLHTMLTGETKVYYEDYAPRPAALLARALAEGFAYQGEPSAHRNGRVRGQPSGHLPPTAFVTFLQNHDQIGNRALGERLHMIADPDGLRAATALILLSPNIPLLFMGEEWGSDAPFLFFTDHHDELAELVRIGRKREFKLVADSYHSDMPPELPDPNHVSTFTASIANPAGAEPIETNPYLTLYRALLAIRHAEIIPRLPGARSTGAHTVGPCAVLAKWRMGDGSVLTIAINLGPDDTPMPALVGRILFETQANAADRAQDGILMSHVAVIALQDAAS